MTLLPLRATEQQRAPHNGRRMMWIAVIQRALEDVAAPPDANIPGMSPSAQRLGAEIRQAHAWFNPANRDFREVCELADLEPETVMVLYKSAVTGAAI